MVGLVEAEVEVVDSAVVMGEVAGITEVAGLEAAEGMEVEREEAMGEG